MCTMTQGGAVMRKSVFIKMLVVGLLAAVAGPSSAAIPSEIPDETVLWFFGREEHSLAKTFGAVAQKGDIGTLRPILEAMCAEDPGLAQKMQETGVQMEKADIEGAIEDAKSLCQGYENLAKIKVPPSALKLDQPGLEGAAKDLVGAKGAAKGKVLSSFFAGTQRLKGYNFTVIGGAAIRSQEKFGSGSGGLYFRLPLEEGLLGSTGVDLGFIYSDYWRGEEKGEEHWAPQIQQMLDNWDPKPMNERPVQRQGGVHKEQQQKQAQAARQRRNSSSDED